MKKFNKKFKEAHGSLIFKQLTGFDISTSDGSAAASEAGVFETRCPELIKTSCNILEEIF